MANRPKKGLDYFPMEVSVFDDIKIRKLIKYQGGQSVAVYAYLLCNIFNEGYYIKWDNELPFVISEKTGLNEAYILEVFKCSLNVGLFSKKLFEESKIITSKGIQERYNFICKILKRVFQIEEFNLLNSEDMPETSEEIYIPSEEIPKTSEELPQRKGKEKKLNQRKHSLAVASNDDSQHKELKKNYEKLIESLEGKPPLEFWEAIKNFIRDEKPTFPEPYFDAWNLFAIRRQLIKQPSSITDKRRKKFATRIMETGFDFLKILECIQASSFLKGDNHNGWKVSIEFILESEENYTKILEGKYA